MAFIITKDLLEDDANITPVFGPRGISAVVIRQLQDGVGTRFRMLDDDGEVYYEGLYIGNNSIVEDEFQPLDCYGTPNAGCTSIQYWETGKGGGWQTL